MNENHHPTDHELDSPMNTQPQFSSFEENSRADNMNTEHIDSPAQSNDPHVAEGSPQGREYTTPGGSHGYVYEPRIQTDGHTGVRKLVIAFCVVGGLILIMGFCLLGAFMAYVADREDGNSGDGSDTLHEYVVPGTSDGLVIMEGEDTEASMETADEFPELQTSGEPAESGVSQTGTEKNTVTAADDGQENASRDEAQGDSVVVTTKATITKETVKRDDADGDGRADVTFDAAGNVLTSAGENAMNTATVVAKISAAVVEISTETVVQSNREQYTTSGAGSGVIIAKEGYIVTNHHVIDGADNITVRLNNGKQFAATLVGSDEATDIAVLLIDAGDYHLTVAPLGCSYNLVAGEDVIAIGNPLGSLGGTVTEGIISATARRINMDGNVMTLLQISAPINPGNSGGGLFNMAGELVGIVNAKVASDDIEGLGFAIPADIAYDVICQLIEYRYVKGRVTSGLTLVEVTNVMTAMQYFNSRYTGVYITASTLTSELQYGDLLMTFDGKEISAAADVKATLSGKRVGDTVDLVVYRKGQQYTVTLTLSEYVPEYVAGN